MKSIISYIKENFNINEDVQSLWKKTAETLEIQSKVKSFFNQMRDKKVSLENKNDLSKTYQAFLKTLTYGTNARTILGKYGIGTPEGFKNFILKEKETLEKNKYNISWVKDFDLSETEKEYRAYKKSDEYKSGEKKEEDDANPRELVIYHRYDPGNYLVYPFSGNRGKSTQHYVRMCRMDFSYETGVKYWETYDCLSKHYFSHTPEELMEMHKPVEEEK